MSDISGVPLLDLTRIDETMREELRAAFDRVLDSGRFVMGPEVAALEEECARYVGAEHAIGVSSGSDALLVCLMALGIGRGDEVICPTYTFFATAGAIARVGATPVFVDCDPWTYNCDPAGVAGRVSARTKAVIPVHLFGQPAAMDPILDTAREHGIPVVEDAAQAIGARHDDHHRAGTLGSFGCFSFFPSKNLGALGDGGFVATKDDALAERVRVLRAHGGKPKYHHRVVGGNFRLDALQAALLRVKLPWLGRATAMRRHNAARYAQLLREAALAVYASTPPGAIPRGRLGLPVTRAVDHVFNQLVVRIGGGQRDALRRSLTERGIGTEIYYPIPMHLQECFRGCGHGAGDFPHAEAAARETLALPVFPGLRDDEIRYVVDCVTRVLRASR